MSEQNNKISIDVYIKSELGQAKYDNIILRAQVDALSAQNQELQTKVQELENKLVKQAEEPKK